MTTAADQAPVPDAPTAIARFSGMEVRLFGREHDDPGRTLDPAARELAALRVRDVRGVRELFAPNPQDFNAKMIDARADSFPLHDVRHDVTIHYGERADGIIGLPKGTGFWIRSADCPTVVLTAGTYVAILHAGLRSLVVQHWRDDYAGAPDRGSVIEHALLRLPVHRRNISVRIFCGIGPESYLLRMDHPVHGKYNEQLVERVTKHWGDACVRDIGHGFQSLSLVHLIRAQLERRGVWGARIVWDKRDTAADVRGGAFVWHSQSRGDRGRNSILILNPKE